MRCDKIGLVDSLDPIFVSKSRKPIRTDFWYGFPRTLVHRTLNSERKDTAHVLASGIDPRSFPAPLGKFQFLFKNLPYGLITYESYMLESITIAHSKAPDILNLIMIKLPTQN